MSEVQRKMVRWGILVAGLALVATAFRGYTLLRAPAGSNAVSPKGDSGVAKSRSEVSGLSDEARKYIWDIEQKAFQISHKAVPALTAALARKDRDALAEFFSTGFAAQVVSRDSGERIRHGISEFQMQRAGDQERQNVGREEFVDWLLSLVERFDPRPQAQLPLLYLSPAQRDQMDGVWQGTWILRVFGKTSSGGPGETVVRGQFTAERLPENFALDRGWISSWDIEQVVVAQSDRPLMEEVSVHSAIDIGRLHDNWKVDRTKFSVTPGGVYACDYNRDGLVDLLITDQGFSTLYAGRGGARFEDVTLQAGLPIEPPQGISQAGATAFADLDNDGDEDLILGGLVLENRDGHFVRRGYVPLLHAVGISVADYDRDGLVDLYISNAAPPPNRATARTSWVDDESGLPNQMWRNLGNFQFVDVTDATGTAAGKRSTFTAAWLDADEDGWPDIYVINELGPNILLHNNRNGTFSEVQVGPEHDGFAMGVAAGDVDGDGKIDLYVGNMFSKAGKRIINNIPPREYPPELVAKMRAFVAGNLLLLNKGAHRFDPSPDSLVSGVGWAYGTAIVDLDGDGRLDLYSTAGFASFSREEPDG